MGMRVPVGMDVVAVAVMPGRHRIEVDPGRLDGRLGLGSVTLRVVAG